MTSQSGKKTLFVLLSAIMAVFIVAMIFGTPASEEALVSGHTILTPTSGPSPTPLPTANPSLIRVVALNDIPGSYDRSMSFDLVISKSAINTTFLSGSMPNLRALIITKSYLDSVIPPGGGGGSYPNGNDTYLKLFSVLEHGHILFVLDSSSNYILTKMDMKNKPAPFDQEGVPVNGSDFSSGFYYAGSALVYEYANANVGPGWVIMDTKSEMLATATPIPITPTPDLGEDPELNAVPVPMDAPPYFAVYEDIVSYIMKREGTVDPWAGDDNGSSQQSSQPCKKIGAQKRFPAHRDNLHFGSFVRITNWPEHPANGMQYCCPKGTYLKTTEVWAPALFACQGTSILSQDKPWVVCEEVITNGTGSTHPFSSSLVPPIPTIMNRLTPTPNPASFQGNPKTALNCWRDDGTKKVQGFIMPEPTRFPFGRYRCSDQEPEDFLSFYSVQTKHQANVIIPTPPRLDKFDPETTIYEDTTQTQDRFAYVTVGAQYPAGAGGSLNIGGTAGSSISPRIQVDVNCGGTRCGGSGPDFVTWDYNEPELIRQAQAADPTYTAADICARGWFRNWCTTGPGGEAICGTAVLPLPHAAVRYDGLQIFRHLSLWWTQPVITTSPPGVKHTFSFADNTDISMAYVWNATTANRALDQGQRLTQKACTSRTMDITYELWDSYQYCSTPIAIPTITDH